MIKLKDLILEGYIRVEKDPDNLTVADGESGRGIYFSVSDYSEMVDYYKRMSGQNFRVIQAKPKLNTNIIDLTKPNILSELLRFMKSEVLGLSKRMPGYRTPTINHTTYQRYGRLIEDFIRRKYPNADAYITNHEFGGDIPKGKQLIIKNENAFDYQDVE